MFAIIRVETSEEFDASFSARDLSFIEEGIAESEEMAVVNHDIVLVSHAGLGGDVHKILQGPIGVAAGRCVRIQVFQGGFEGFPVTSAVTIERLPKIAYTGCSIMHDSLHLLTVAEATASGMNVVFKQEIGDRVVALTREVRRFQARGWHGGLSRDRVRGHDGHKWGRRVESRQVKAEPAGEEQESGRHEGDGRANCG